MEERIEETVSEKEEEILKLLADFATAVEAAALQLKQAIGKIVKVEVGTISEEPFLSLKWEKKAGAKLKEYEFTSKAANNSNDAFHHCFTILKANRAAINNRFYCEGWKYSYWLYANNPDVIYRQLLKTARTQGPATKKVAKPWTCSACGYDNDANHLFFCQKCGQRNIATYG